MGVNASEYAIHLQGRDGGVVSVLPGEEIPSWAKVTNPLVTGEAGDEESADDHRSGPPPRAGKGSGEDKWRAYADEHGVDVSDAEGRDDVIAALEEAGVQVDPGE